VESKGVCEGGAGRFEVKLIFTDRDSQKFLISLQLVLDLLGFAFALVF
jgi:hypothetical protein